MITSGRFSRSASLILFSLAVLIHFYFNRTTLNPRYGKVFYKLGLECQNKCSLNKQLSYFQKAVFYDPNLKDAYYQMGIIYGKQGESEKEFVSYKKVATLDYANVDVHFKVGRYYFEKGEWDYALRCFLQSNRYKPGSYDTLNYLAQSYEKKQMYKEAVHYYVPVVGGRTHLSAEACKRIWHISKIPGQSKMVSDEVYRIYDSAEQGKLWEQIDRYLETDQVPEFMQKFGERDGFN